MRKETLLKIMGLFRKNLDEGITILQISKRLNIGYRPAYNHINEMNNENMIIIKKVGKAKECFLNLKSEKARHVLGEIDILRKEGLYKKEGRLKNILENLIKKLSEKYVSEIQSIVLFGSYAKGKAVKGSDIDLLFIVNDMKNKKLRADIERECASFEYSYNLKISPIITDAAEFRRMLKSEELNVGKEVRDHGMILYGFEHFWRIAA
ncbi:nucleotidyltransferase domain-containing protein [Candidatus Woesearchaeota archaeon]|nr:nucleotidyltransferase domain-containing protein [Candidatus Woesearchaeota archaeon]